MKTLPRRRRAGLLLVLVLTALAMAGPAMGQLSSAVPTAQISGEGSSWAGNAVDNWRAGVAGQGVTMNFNANGSSIGRKDFALGLADFAVSEIPYTGDTKDPNDTNKPDFGYAMLPVVAGGTAFMYNLPINGQRYTQLNLSQRAIAKIFTGQATTWNDPVIATDNPGVNLPSQPITVVVRSDGSGATAQFTLFLKRQFPQDYAALCAKTGCDPNSATSYFSTSGLDHFTAQSGSIGVTTYTSNTPYTINYDEYSYATGINFPVAKVKNAAGFYIEPTDTAVAVALTQAKINNDTTSDNYLSQDLSAVYPYGDPRSYPMSAYSYMLEPTELHGNFSSGKGATLAYLEQFALCEGQRTMGQLGYSPLPMNLVLLAMDQVLKVPGIGADTQKQIADTKAGVTSGASNPCNNPTFKPGDSPSVNQLIKTAPFPEGCDAACQAPWIGAVSGGPDTNTSSQDSGKGGKKGGKKNPGTSTSAPPTDTATQTGTPDPGAPTAGIAAPIDAGSSDDPTQTCDPDTGLCTGDSAPAAAGSGDANMVATPYELAGKQIWGTAQLALVISVLLGALLIFGPPLVARALDTKPRRAPKVPAPRHQAPGGGLP